MEVRSLGKAYRQYGSELSRIASWFGIPTKPITEQWVLRNINFSVAKGEAVGIVGQNGAGKSTLLKLVTGTVRPTQGRVEIAGRIAAILELGMGFDPNLTGRENAVHGLGLMGFSSDVIAGVLPELEEFAEVGEYFDQPVRTYSSGMQMRVAFAVATAIRPEILIIDEALSVGDTYFQHKSFNRIREFKKEGTTLLFVSHDRGAVQAICNRAILLDNGQVLKDGRPSEVMDYYNALIAEKENSTVELAELDNEMLQTTSGTGEATVQTIGLYNAFGNLIECANVGEPTELRVRVRVIEDIGRLVLGYQIKDRLGQDMFGTNTWHTEQALSDMKSGDVVDFTIRFPMNLGPGGYSVSTALVSTDTHLVDNYEWRDLALVFDVINQDKPIFVGSSWIHPVIEITEK